MGSHFRNGYQKFLHETIIMESKLEDQRERENPHYKATWVQTEQGARVEHKFSTKYGSAREKHLLGHNMSDPDFQELCELEHSKLELVYHCTWPSAAIPIAACGFAPSSGTGCDERIRMWKCDPPGAYHAQDPSEGIELYPHSVRTEQPGELPG